MPKKKTPDFSLPSSWKDLTPKSTRRSGSRSVLRKRGQLGLKLFSLMVVLGLIGLVGFLSKQGSHAHPSGILKFDGIGPTIHDIRFQTDGSLNERWFRNWFGPVRNRTLMDVNLEELHDNLLEEEQIVTVQIAREFPSTLRVSVEELQPVLVLRMRDAEKKFQDWLVSTDGSLFLGQQYSPSRLALLPSLQVSPKLLSRNAENDGYEKLSGMGQVSPLLELARREYPDLYRDWRVVSYERPDESDPGAHVMVQSKRVGRIRFSPGGYAEQMKRLRYLLMEPRFAKAPRIESIDLSHDRSVFAKI